MSLPARGARIEIVTCAGMPDDVKGRSPQGERGLKYIDSGLSRIDTVVAPRKGSAD